MLADVPPLLEDLLEIAAYVLAADAATDRGDPTLPDMGEDWRRRFRFVIPVRRPEVWASSELTALLADTLSFLSEDDYRFEFVDLQTPVPLSTAFSIFEIRSGTTEAPTRLYFFPAASTYWPELSRICLAGQTRRAG